MSLVVFVVVTFAAAALAIALRARRRGPRLRPARVGGGDRRGARHRPGQTLVIGGSGLATSAYSRLFLILGSVVGLGLTVAGLASGTRRDAPAVTLTILGSAALTMALVDPRLAVLAATTGGLFGVLITLTPRDGRAGATVGILRDAGRRRRRCAGDRRDSLDRPRPQPAGCAAGRLRARLPRLRARRRDAFRGDPVPPLGGAPDRCRARDGAPVLTAIAPASLAVVALAWVASTVAPLAVDLTPERYVVLAIAVATIVLAAVAAFVQDDLEHVAGLLDRR